MKSESTSQARRKPSSRIRFPRFEYESNPDLPINDRELIQRAEKRDWISEQVVDWHRKVARMSSLFDVERINMRAETGYWGQYHTAHKRQGEPLTLSTAFRGRATESLLWLTTYNHEYCWDAQAVGGTSTEVVLQGFSQSEESGVKEIAAMLIERPVLSKVSTQRVVVNGAEGWHEPDQTEMFEARSMVFAMSHLALNEVLKA